MAGVVLKHVSKKYGDTPAVTDINLHIHDKEFVVLVGPSGCGKSTTLRMIAGLEEITSGEIMIGDRVVNAVAPKDRDIAMVFQNYALYPHMTVYENMAFGLKLRRLPAMEIRRRVEEAAEVVGLTPYLKRRPASLSGGQRQRVALGRAIVRNPEVFLFDEPLSNLDAKLRVQMRLEISKLQRRLGVTTIYVTHDQTEAMTMADRIAVMKDGVLQQFDTPMNLYHRPANLFVAGFIGSPAMNMIEGNVDDARSFSDASGEMILPPGESISSALKPGKCILGVRPENIHGDNRLHNSSYAPVRVQISAVEPLGSDSYLYFTLGGQEMIARVRPETVPQAEDEAELFVDLAGLHFFDPATGERIG